MAELRSTGRRLRQVNEISQRPRRTDRLQDRREGDGAIALRLLRTAASAPQGER